MNRSISVARLFKGLRLGRLYTFVLRSWEVTIDDVVNELAMPRTTAYSDTATLVDLWIFLRDGTQKTHTYTATPLVLTTDLNGNGYTTTPTTVEAIDRSSRDQDLDLLLERHGLGKLAAALACAVLYTDGEISEHVAARELGLQVVFAIAVIHSLRGVVLEMRAHDPYFDRIRSANDHSSDTEV